MDASPTGFQSSAARLVTKLVPDVPVDAQAPESQPGSLVPS